MGSDCRICPHCGNKVPPPSNERLVVGTLTLWPDTGIAAIGEKRLRLRTALGISACRILATLMRNPGQVTTTDHLMAASGTGTISALRVRLTSLRNLVGSDVEIKSESGVGYRIHPRPSKPERKHKQNEHGALVWGSWFESDELEQAIQRARQEKSEHDDRRAIEKLGL